MAVMIEVGFHLNSLHFPSQHPQITLSHFRCRPISVSNRRLLFLLSPWPRRCRRWDSNAESYSNSNFSFDSNGESEDFNDSVEQWAEVLDDYIDSIWILKVFGSYGWMLPPILLSLLLANGLKAFLLALALPLGQSTISFAIQRFQKRNKIKAKRQRKSKKGRSRVSRSRDVGLDEPPEFIIRQGERKEKKGYQSWVFQDDVTGSSNDRSASNFGGWEELDSEMDSNIRSSRRAARKSSGGGTPARKGKSRILRDNDGPLLLRLLISIFPFLSSWTKML